eukprot:g23172.t1
MLLHSLLMTGWAIYAAFSFGPQNPKLNLNAFTCFHCLKRNQEKYPKLWQAAPKVDGFPRRTRSTMRLVENEKPVPLPRQGRTSGVGRKTKATKSPGHRRSRAKFNLTSPPGARDLVRNSTRNLFSPESLTEKIDAMKPIQDSANVDLSKQQAMREKWLRMSLEAMTSKLWTQLEVDAQRGYERSRDAWRANVRIDLSIGLKFQMLSQVKSCILLQLYRQNNPRLGELRPHWERLGMTAPAKIQGQAFRIRETLNIKPNSLDEKYRVRVVETDADGNFLSVLGVAALLASDFISHAPGADPTTKFLKFNLRQPTVYGPVVPIIGPNSWLLVKSSPVYLETVWEAEEEEEREWQLLRSMEAQAEAEAKATMQLAEALAEAQADLVTGAITASCPAPTSDRESDCDNQQQQPALTIVVTCPDNDCATVTQKPMVPAKPSPTARCDQEPTSTLVLLSVPKKEEHLAERGSSSHSDCSDDETECHSSDGSHETLSAAGSSRDSLSGNSTEELGEEQSPSNSLVSRLFGAKKGAAKNANNSPKTEKTRNAKRKGLTARKPNMPSPRASGFLTFLSRSPSSSPSSSPSPSASPASCSESLNLTPDASAQLSPEASPRQLPTLAPKQRNRSLSAH